MKATLSRSSNGGEVELLLRSFQLSSASTNMCRGSEESGTTFTGEEGIDGRPRTLETTEADVCWALSKLD